MHIKLNTTRSDSRFRLKSYLINLDSREDRLHASINEAKKCGIELHRVRAIEVGDLSHEEIQKSLLTEGALACLRSHQKVWRLISEGSESYGLVLEDDFLIKNKKRFLKVCQSKNLKDFDILQLGYLRMNFRYWIDIQIQNIESKLFFLFAHIIQKKESRIVNRLRIKRHRSLTFNQVADDFRAGAHAYIISKSAASRLLLNYRSDFITVDGYLCAVAWTRSFKVVRSSKSLVGQSKSESSIKNWGSVGGQRSFGVE